MGLIETKVGEFSIGEAFAIGLSKAVTEQMLAPVIGNGTVLSGGIKMAGAYGVGRFFKGSVGKIVATGLAVDGVEDIITALLGQWLAPASSNTGASSLI